MPTSSAPTTSSRLLSLLSLLQAHRDRPGRLLAERLAVSERTVRRDVDRLRELGYPIRAVKGPDGGYRLDAGTRMPPLLFDEEQAVALAVALGAAAGTGAGVAEAAMRALATVRQVMPARLRQRVDGLAFTTAADRGTVQADPEVLLAVSDAIRAREELRFDYRSPATTAGAAVPGGAVPGGAVPDDNTGPHGADRPQPPRRVQPHHLVARGGRWYLLAWDPRREDWRTYRVDRMTPRVPTGPRFTPREVPGGDVAGYLAARAKGSDGPDAWPCTGEALLDLPAARVAPFVADALVEAVGPDRCRVRIGAWSWPGLAATLARFDADLVVVGPPALREAFAALAARADRAARA